MHLKTSYTLLVFLFFLNSVQSSQIDTRNQYWENWQVALLSYKYIPDSKLDSGNNSFSEQRLKAYIFFPIVMKNKFTFATGIDYEFIHLSFDQFEPFSNPFLSEINYSHMNSSLHKFDLILSFCYEFTKKWFIYWECDPGIHSDFLDLNDRDILVTAFAYAGIYSQSKNIFRIGLGCSYSFGNPLFYPILGTHFKINNRFTLDIFLPSHAMLHIKLTKQLETGIKTKFTYQYYRLTQKPPWHNTILMSSHITIGPYIEWNIVKDLVTRIEVGIIPWHNIKLYEQGNSNFYWGGGAEINYFFDFSVRWAY